MKNRIALPAGTERPLTRREAFLWLNDNWSPLAEARVASELGLADVYEAEARLQRFARVLSMVFPELQESAGVVESPLYPANQLQEAMMGAGGTPGRWFIKGDHALPVAGSIKARGGLYEVLTHAESLALRHGIMKPNDDSAVLASLEARELFAKHEISVGSTGNLGLSIGLVAAVLGFRAVVHMSADAKEWKKVRLRDRGVEVVEHRGDYGAAVAAGREQARVSPNVYFVDDENSKHLFLGYAVAAIRLCRQFLERGVRVDAKHPLFVYLPCGVGGAPGGITFGLRHLLGDSVHCFLAEPVASPCMLISLASPADAALSVEDVGLDNRTEADGLAVGRASEFVAPLMRRLASGVFTVPDEHLFEDLYLLEQTERLHIEPSAAAAFRGPRWILHSPAGQQYLLKHGLTDSMADATHVLWTTGGSFVPETEFRRFHERGRALSAAKG